MAHPERLIVAHPFNPVYLLPLVEIVAGERTDAGRRSSAPRPSTPAIGMKPLVMRKEIDAFVGDRLLEASGARRCGWSTTTSARRRRSTTSSAIRFGLRWAQMGTVRDLSHRRRRGRHAPFHEPVRPGAEMAVDQAHGRAGARRRAGRQDRRAVGRAGGRAAPSASWSASATTTWSPSCRRCEGEAAGAPARCWPTRRTGCSTAARRSRGRRTTSRGRSAPCERACRRTGSTITAT